MLEISLSVTTAGSGDAFIDDISYDNDDLSQKLSMD